MRSVDAPGHTAATPKVASSKKGARWLACVRFVVLTDKKGRGVACMHILGRSVYSSASIMAPASAASIMMMGCTASAADAAGGQTTTGGGGLARGGGLGGCAGGGGENREMVDASTDGEMRGTDQLRVK
jgi:hypothetical protein